MKLDEFRKLSTRKQSNELKRLKDVYNKLYAHSGSKVRKEGRCSTTLTEIPELEVSYCILEEAHVL